MLTARTDVATKIAAVRAAFDDLLVKTMEEPELIARLGAARRLIVRQRRLDAAVRELYGLATRDELTSLFNRRFFFAEAERRLAGRAPVGLILLHIDDLQTVHDTPGQPARERLLRDIAALSLRNTRHEALTAGYGGDEFIMLIASNPPNEITRIGTRLAAEITELEWVPGETPFHVGVTIGVAASSVFERPLLELLLEAGDRDLYEKKNAVKG